VDIYTAECSHSKQSVGTLADRAAITAKIDVLLR
jgi:hypothetical protein